MKPFGSLARLRFSCNRTGRIATGSFGYYSFSDRASINRTDTITGGGGADVLTGGGGADRFAWTANGQSLTTNNALTLAAADTITDFSEAQTDVIAFTAGLANGPGNYAFGANADTIVRSFTAGQVSVITLNADGTAGAAGAAGNGALVVFNGTAAAVDLSGGANTTAALLASTGLQVIQLAGQAGINYGTLDAGDFLFA